MFATPAYAQTAGGAMGAFTSFMPLILIYTTWVYSVLWGRTSTAALKTNPDLY